MDFEQACTLSVGSPATRRRLRAAHAAAGLAGLEALYPSRRLDSQLVEFYRTVALDYLALHGLEGTVQCGPNRLLVALPSARFQLRIAPDRCRWLLLVHRGKRWQPYVPGKPCLDLVDLLKQVRRLTTVAPDCRK